MNNTSMPMSPGVKSQPLEDIAWLAWNRQGNCSVLFFTHYLTLKMGLVWWVV